ncbi:MAG: excinuclease ABC subunit UvrC [Rhabdochlamydiaceae bacterium]|nr:excinuclease ABC subunit UvrC [Candidatus Amphrikana amoebophyrae]
MFDIKKAKLPTEPGVYIMRNKNRRILYVGKAKNLNSRVRQYFQSGGDGREMIPILIAQVADIETVIALSEKDALLLENSLIKQHKPKYNVLLKDDKTYVSLSIDPKQKWPTLKLIRYKGKPKAGALYFGPYISGFKAKQAHDTLLKTFPLRQCSDHELKSRQRPCLLYDMKRCIAPCKDKCTKEEYDEHVDNIVRFLKGNDPTLVKELTQKRKELSDKMEYEKAQIIHGQIDALKKISESHKFTTRFNLDDTDVLALHRGENGEFVICKMTIRNGRFAESRSFHIPMTVAQEVDILTSFMMQHYATAPTPKHILSQLCLPKALEEILNVKISSPQKGEKMKLISMAKKNGKAYLESFVKKEKELQELLLKLQELCLLDNFPKRIECFDTSHMSSENPTASMAVFINGQKSPSESRKYKIKHSEKSEDYASMKEILERRLKRGKAEDNLPDLIILDGGKGQLGLATKIMQELNVISCDLIALTKEEARHDKGLSKERIFIPGKKEAIELPHKSPLQFFLQRVRDESHDMAITYHRKKRKEGLIKSALDQVAGIGPKKKKLLITHFGSVKRIKEASFEDLISVKGISKTEAQSIIDNLGVNS